MASSKHGRTGKPISVDPARLGYLDALNLAFVQDAALPGDRALTSHAAITLALHVVRSVIEAGELGRFLPAHLAPTAPIPTA